MADDSQLEKRLTDLESRLSNVEAVSIALTRMLTDNAETIDSILNILESQDRDRQHGDARTSPPRRNRPIGPFLVARDMPRDVAPFGEARHETEHEE
jgi:uncharacterized coiled-coil protein SlyX